MVPHTRKIIYFVAILMFLFAIVPTNINADKDTILIKDEITKNITSLKDKIANLKDNAKLLSDEIIQQKQIIIHTNKELDDSKNNLQELKNNNDDTWESIGHIINAKQEVVDIKKKLDHQQNQLHSLLNEKGTNTKSIQISYKDLKILEKKLSSTISESQLIQDENMNSSNSTGYDEFNNCITMIKNNTTICTPHIGIRLDKTCEILIQLGYSDCPTYDEIDEFFPNMKPTKQYSFLISTENNTANIIKNKKHIEANSKFCIVTGICNFFNTPYSRYWHNPNSSISDMMDIITITPNMKIKNQPHLKYENITSVDGKVTQVIHSRK